MTGKDFWKLVGTWQSKMALSDTHQHPALSHHLYAFCSTKKEEFTDCKSLITVHN